MWKCALHVLSILMLVSWLGSEICFRAENFSCRLLVRISTVNMNLIGPTNLPIISFIITIVHTYIRAYYPSVLLERTALGWLVSGWECLADRASLIHYSRLSTHWSAAWGSLVYYMCIMCIYTTTTTTTTLHYYNYYYTTLLQLLLLLLLLLLSDHISPFPNVQCPMSSYILTLLVIVTATIPSPYCYVTCNVA